MVEQRASITLLGVGNGNVAHLAKRASLRFAVPVEVGVRFVEDRVDIIKGRFLRFVHVAQNVRRNRRLPKLGRAERPAQYGPDVVLEL